MSLVQPVSIGKAIRMVNGVPILTEEVVEGTFFEPGQLYVGTGVGIGTLLPPGPDGSVLTSLASAPAGIEWGTAGGASDAVFSWPGTVVTGDASGEYLPILGYAATMALVTLTVATADSGGNDITVTYLLNGSSFTTLTLASGQTSTFLDNPSSWPTVGDNTTDVLQAQITTYAGSGGTAAVNLVAQIRL